MPAPVTRLFPNVASLEDALSSYRAGELRKTVSTLHGQTSFSAHALKARALLRLGDAPASLALMEGSSPTVSAEKAERSLLVGVALSRLSEVSRAHESFAEALVHSITANDLALEAEVDYYRGLTAFSSEDLTEARASCVRGLTTSRSSGSVSSVQRAVELSHVVSRIETLLGIIGMTEGNYADALDFTRNALISLENEIVRDAYLEGFALKNLTILARDLDIEDDARKLVARVPAFAWSSDAPEVEFTTFEALGWCVALRGNAVEALRYFRQAANAATSAPEQILVGIDRALIAREYGHTPLVIDEVDHAFDLSDRFDWEGAAGDYRVALLTLAQAAARISPERARQSLERYTHIRNKMDATFAARVEPRARAEEDYTHGLVLRAEGRLAASTDRLRSAFETWERIGFEWRAGRAAIELAELDAGDVFRLAVRRELNRRPNSIFSSRARLVA